MLQRCASRERRTVVRVAKEKDGDPNLNATPPPFAFGDLAIPITTRERLSEHSRPPEMMRRRRRAPKAPELEHEHVVTMSVADFARRENPNDADAPILTHIDRASTSGRRVYTETVPIQPPSPVKNYKKRRATQESEIELPAEGPDAAPAYDPAEYNSDDERYDMFPDTSPKASRKLRRLRGMFEPSLNKWRPLRGDFLDELLRRDGCGGAHHACAECSASEDATFRCTCCFGVHLYCQQCIVALHRANPLHIVEHWDGTCFEKVPLKDLGLRVQLGHAGCVKPRPAPENFVVLDTNSIHEVAVDFCGCSQAVLHGEPYVQLLRAGWYPATVDKPQTAATFAVLDLFHALTLQAKTTMYDFYVTLERMTNSAGLKPPHRYSEFLQMTRQYRHILLLKRAGRGHDPSGVYGTQPGECAVLCPACPRPGVNLPEDWHEAPPEKKFLYIIFIALDACFRLKRRLVSSDLRDPGLGTGWAYLTETQPYREFLLTVTDQKEMSTCSGLAALDYANTKFSRGYSSTGVGMGVCARHEFVQPTGVGDLQKGERYANMDYIFASLARHIDPRLFKVVSYDIVCQWWKYLKGRLAKLPPHLRLYIVMKLMHFVIPKMHIHSHTVACQVLFSLNFLLGAGQTDGEGIERPWANIGAVATSTREQGPGFRHDTLDDHWNYWNWVKLILLARLLRRKLDNAKVQAAAQKDAFESFSQQQGEERVTAWRHMVDEFDADNTKPNPYAAEIHGLSEGQVRLQFAEEEKKRVEEGVPSLHDVSPSSFIYAGLALEEEQRRVRVQAELKKAKTTGQQITMTGVRRKLARGIQRFRKLQGIYTPSALQAAARVRVPTEPGQPPPEELPEDTCLFLPAALSEEERKSCLPGLVEIEAMARDAQCRTALVRLRNQLHIKSRLLLYKKNHSKIRLHSEKYQAAWRAIRQLKGGDATKVGWAKLRKQDIRMMEDPEELTKREEKRKKRDERRRIREERLRAEGEWVPYDAPAVAQEEEEEQHEGSDEEERRRAEGRICERYRGFGKRQVGRTDTLGHPALRIEWAKAYARSRRWTEEVQLLEEEARRICVSFDYTADLWTQRRQAVDLRTVSAEVAEGAKAYATRQARMFREMKHRAKITLTEPKLANGKKRQRRRRRRRGGGGGGEEEEEEDVDEVGDWVGEGNVGERGNVGSDEEYWEGGEDDVD
ncbi:hypothetical protein C8R43DRAFT_1142184 [Mycena crocata]|nr:hypothetical protein C8R43DRAFT_1142184 [Mycena crocata]